MKARHRLLLLFQYAAGLTDTATGLLLIFVPSWTLQLMRVNSPPKPIQFASFIGVFVLGVGLTYLWIAVRSPMSLSALVWEVQWSITALIRALVALFLFIHVTSGSMEPAWLTVAFSDATLATIQGIGLCRGWFRSGE